MLRVIELVRASAHAPLDLTLLERAQRLVLDGDARLRSRDAYAHAGRERYGTPHDLRDALEACLAEAESPGLPAVHRAARAYLDVCFFHPFADGNARAARLAFDHVLMRAGVALHSVEPVFLLPRRATDPQVLWETAYVAGLLVGARGY